MKKPYKIILATAILLFLTFRYCLIALIEGAQAVGDADSNFNARIYSSNISLVITLVLDYFGIKWAITKTKINLYSNHAKK